MPEPDANASDRELGGTSAQEPWHDKVLVDAIGYTKGLVAILDSLSDGFQRRGRELEEQRTRLAILQSERRKILEERSAFDARIAALSAERDGLRTALDERERDLAALHTRLAGLDDERRTVREERSAFDARIAALSAERDGLRTALDERERDLAALRQEVARGQAALDVQTREIDALQSDLAGLTRQAEELREVVRSLERQLQRDGLRTALDERERDLAALHTRLAGLDDERRTVREERSAFDARIAALSAERDGLRTALDERERDLAALRQEVARGQAALQAQTRELQALRVGMAETVRQAEEIRKVLQALEAESEDEAHRRAILEEALEVERRQGRETVARAGQERAALQEDLADAENLLAEARKDIARSQGLIANLQRTVDEERARNAALQAQFEAQTAELAQLNATVQAVPTLLNELVRAFSGSGEEARDASDAEGRGSAWLESLVRDSAVVAPSDREALAILQPIREVLRDLLPPAAGAAAREPGLATDVVALRRRAERIAEQWRRVVRTDAGSPGPAEPVRGEGEPFSGQSAPDANDGADRPDDEPAESATNDRAVGNEATRVADAETAKVQAVAPGGQQQAPRIPGSPPGMTVECRIPASGAETARILRGEIGRINDMGMLGAFEERFSEGQEVAVRFVREGALVSCVGRVVRVQESVAGHDTPAVFNHLIRFESQIVPAGDSSR